MNRQQTLQSLRDSPAVSVLIIGGGVNGIGAFRDLALQGVDVLLVERGDFGGGTSAASSHMLHGGIRYLENGEFRLVREALRERDLMLGNAPHYAKPLRTTIPVFRWLSGMLNAPLKFAGLLDRPGERGALVIKLGLTLYDFFVGAGRRMPQHEFRLRQAALREYPRLSPDIVCAASYYDAWMPSPERICLEMTLDAEASGGRALNYVSLQGAEGAGVGLRDELTGERLRVEPAVVINAAGPWIDLVNDGLGRGGQRFIGGTKGSHLVLDHPELLAATGGSEFFFENDDGRITLILPFFERVMIGTTDIPVDDPESIRVSEEEIDYLLAMPSKVFPGIRLERSQIVFAFVGLRPLPYSEAGAQGKAGQISRDHSIRRLPPTRDRPYPTQALIGGKWTTFRAFAEEASELALRDLGRTRRVSTAKIPIGGGKLYPAGEREQERWLRALRARCELPLERLTVLFERYGTRADQIADYISRGGDQTLRACPAYSRREIEFILRREKVERLEDLLLRRTLIAMLGQTTRALLDEMAAICAATLGWPAERQADEIRRTIALLRERHLVDLERV